PFTGRRPAQAFREVAAVALARPAPGGRAHHPACSVRAGLQLQRRLARPDARLVTGPMGAGLRQRDHGRLAGRVADPVAAGADLARDRLPAELDAGPVRRAGQGLHPQLALVRLLPAGAADDVRLAAPAGPRLRPGQPAADE